MAEPRDFKKEMGCEDKPAEKPAFSEVGLVGAMGIVMMKEEMELKKSISNGIALLFAENSCKSCDGTHCLLLEKDGITCMGIEGLEIIPKASARLFNPQWPIMSCGECGGEGCCDGQPPTVIPLEALLERRQESPCSGSVCDACDECEP